MSFGISVEIKKIFCVVKLVRVSKCFCLIALGVVYACLSRSLQCASLFEIEITRNQANHRWGTIEFSFFVFDGQEVNP